MTVLPFIRNEFRARQEGKSLALDRLINQLIADNKEIIIGTSYPKARLLELQTKFPNARFELCGMGVKLCNSK